MELTRDTAENRTELGAEKASAVPDRPRSSASWNAPIGAHSPRTVPAGLSGRSGTADWKLGATRQLPASGPRQDGFPNAM